ncbi:MAG: hypothetical protein IPO63_01785 [Bacteroidetes bacterium]|nr:hypothetical protein [Bacteroidota bacterium]
MIILNMRTINIIVVVFFTISISACKSSKNSSENAEKTETEIVDSIPSNPARPLVSMEIWTHEQAKLGPDTFRLVVSFISIGAGTDPESKAILEAYVYDYKLKNNKVVSYFMIPWGREGEVDCCFTLNELNASEQNNFIDGLKKVIQGKELIQINENMKSRFK